MGRKLYVGNLPFSTTEGELEELFGRMGSVESVNVIRDMATGRARGFAFVEMATDEAAQKAVQELDQQALGARDAKEVRASVQRGRGRFVPGRVNAPGAGGGRFRAVTNSPRLQEATGKSVENQR